MAYRDTRRLRAGGMSTFGSRSTFGGFSRGRKLRFVTGVHSSAMREPDKDTRYRVRYKRCQCVGWPNIKVETGQTLSLEYRDVFRSTINLLKRVSLSSLALLYSSPLSFILPTLSSGTHPFNML